MDDPTALLVAPGEPDASVSNGFANPLDLFNYVSPSAWINAAIEELTGVDVIGWMTNWVSGDWAAIWKFGDALHNLGQCLEQLGINIQQGMLDLDPAWDGNASDAAYQYFSNFAAAVGGQQSSLYGYRRVRCRRDRRLRRRGPDGRRHARPDQQSVHHHQCRRYRHSRPVRHRYGHRLQGWGPVQSRAAVGPLRLPQGVTWRTKHSIATWTR